MTRRCHGLLATFLVVSLTALAACGGKSPTSPTPVDSGSPAPAPAPAPAPVPAPAPAPSGSATLSGQVVSNAAALDASAFAAGLPGIVVSVVGTTLTTTADDNGRFSLSNVPSGDQQLSLSGGGTDATVRVTGIAEQERIEITVVVAGRSAEVVGQQRVNGAEAQVEGRIAAVDEGPRTIRIGGMTVSVPAGTPIRHGARSLTFANLHVNDRVHVKGALSGATVIASEVNVQQGDDTPGNGSQTEERVKGPVTAVNGSCPDKRLTVNGKTVQLSGDTQYLLGATCGALVKGVFVEAEGPASGSTLAARTLKIEDNAGGGGGGNGGDDNGADVSVTGAISGRSGSCPTLTFTVQGKTVTTTAATDFRKGTCEQFVNGVTVEAEGVLTGNTLAAKKVQLQD